MLTRALEPLRSSFFLFGPRGTGKSTWIRARFADALVFNLLQPEKVVQYERDPTEFRPEVLPVEVFLRRLHDGDIIG